MFTDFEKSITQLCDCNLNNFTLAHLNIFNIQIVLFNRKNMFLSILVITFSPTLTECCWFGLTSHHLYIPAANVVVQAVLDACAVYMCVMPYNHGTELRSRKPKRSSGCRSMSTGLLNGGRWNKSGRDTRQIWKQNKVVQFHKKVGRGWNFPDWKQTGCLLSY